MSSQGWVSIHRKIQDSWLWEEKPFDKARAFIDLILLVNHEDKEILVDGEIKTIKRGQRLTSISKLSKRWGWNSRTVKRFLVLLEQDQKITLDITPRKHTMITLKNYQKYQGEKSESTSPSTQESTSQSASRDIH
ncbi:MAG: hypothetical protein Q4Q13_05955, partial [Vagococcus sp.]|nr:hypothetical protein [Vagococcus sp.]